jgi:hypothetical protein
MDHQNRAPKGRLGNRPPKGRLALWLALGGLLASLVGTVGIFVGFGLLSAAFVTGIQAKREAKAKGETAPGSTPAIVIGAVSLVFVFIGLIGLLIFRTEVMRFDECSLGANTEVARQACMDRFISDLQERLRR